MKVTAQQREEIAAILRRRANEVAEFKADYTKDRSHFGSVELALTREIDRLRDLADSVEEDGLAGEGHQA